MLRGERFDEAYLYWRFLCALVRPGQRVPITSSEKVPQHRPSRRDDADKRLFLEEARAQLANQTLAMQFNHTRAATLLTIAVAELVFLATRAADAISAGVASTLLFFIGFTFSALALGGAASVLTAQALYGTVDLPGASDEDGPLLDSLVDSYGKTLSIGERTNAARLTVLRDAVFLAVLAGLPILGLVTLDSQEPERCDIPPGYACQPIPLPTTSTTPAVGVPPTVSSPSTTAPASTLPTPTPTPAATSTKRPPAPSPIRP